MNDKRRIPIIPTILVALACAVMIALGFWQIQRLSQKEAAIARYRAEMKEPPAAYPVGNPTDENYLFRVLSANCLRVVRWETIGGRSQNDEPGWRHIAYCATGAEGPGLVVDVGIAAKPDLKIDWTGGSVVGVATYEPDHSTLIERITGKALPLRLMIVTSDPAPGLAPSKKPDPSSAPNNHLAYAVQWFLFAGIAAAIYALALRKRWRDAHGKRNPPRL